MIDFKIKGTKLPDIPIGLQFNVWGNWESFNNTHVGFISFGTVIIQNEVCILAEKENYHGSLYFKIKESDIIKLAKEQGMIDDFVLPEKWCILRNESNYEIINNWMNIHHKSKGFWCKNGHVTNTSLFSEGKEFSEITFEQFLKYVLNKKENNMNKEIIKYKLIKPEYETACNLLLSCTTEYRGVSREGINSKNDITILKNAGVLDLWFEPVYKSTEKTISVGGKFDVVIKDGKIFHVKDDITAFVEEMIMKFKPNSYKFGGFSAIVSDIQFSSTGCRSQSTNFSDWVKVYDEYLKLK